MATRIQLRRATTAEWAAANPILAVGEPGFDRSLRMMKVGDGTTPWADLPAFDLGLPVATDGQTIMWDGVLADWVAVAPPNGADILVRPTNTTGVVTNYTSAGGALTIDIPGLVMVVPAQTRDLYLGAGTTWKSNAAPGAATAVSLVAKEVANGIDAPVDVTLRAEPPPANGQTRIIDSMRGRGFIGPTANVRTWKIQLVTIGVINMDVLNSAAWPSYGLAEVT